ncbi:hypothetical protein [Leeuwenhoekiella marinoflava]|uniref:Carboxypeptidase-like protein n=2 Tax=Leeuwenhoekiella marinoflava TaxID=988 RepID=A0A4Q0PQQ7_9FLAO|nr:hypothetical protein [Leeuwenhoekiella marinoflava]RXG32911.1 hypothetical protein DSL99_2 [Leeuwenhoekiella marinoflava]SHE31709.1 hypothetical protein SAMN02745246_00061 [Leeuwenhoekiella marinoflava DSM 3653]
MLAYLKIIITGAVISCSFSFSYSQTLSGTLLNGLTKEPVEGASVIITNEDNPGIILAYSYSNNLGFFEIKIPSDLKSDVQLIFTITALAYEKYEDQGTINSIQIPEIVFLKEAENVLPEIKIVDENKAIRIKNDTTFFKVSKFTDGTEKTVEDLLRKLPGIDIDDDGTIKYKKKRISAFLIEGDDLFKNDYIKASRNINIGIIEEIQALENFSENPLLKNIENSDKVAINLKLTDDANAIYSNLELGLGTTKRYQNNLDFLEIAKKTKAFGLVNANNTGIRNDQKALSFEKVKTLTSKPNYIISPLKYGSLLKGNRTNRNKALYSSVNTILNISQTISTKFNFSYFTDLVKQNTTSENNFFIAGEDIKLQSSQQAFQKPKSFIGDFEILANLNLNSKIEVLSQFGNDQQEVVSNVLNNGLAQELAIENKQINANTNINYTQKLSENKAFTLNLKVHNSEINQLLKSEIENQSNDLLQVVATSYDLKEFEAKFYQNFGKAKLTYSLGAFYENNEMQSQLEDNSLSNNYINDTKLNRSGLYFKGSYFKKLNDFSINFKSTLSYLNQSLSQEQLEKDGILFNPSLNLKYDLSNSSALSLFSSFNTKSQPLSNLFTRPILVSFRTLISNTPDLTLSKTFNYGANYRYTDTYNSFSINTGVTIDEIRNNFIASQNILLNQSRLDYFVADNSDRNNQVYLNLSKYIFPLRSKFSVNTQYKNSQLRSSFAPEEFQYNTVDQFKIDFEISNGFFKKTLFIDNSITYRTSTLKTAPDIRNTVSNFENDLEIKYLFSEKLKSRLNYNYINNGSNNFNFLDFQIDYKSQKLKVDFSLIGNNLLNISSYQINSNDEVSQTSMSYQLIERYFLLQTSFKF